MIAILNALLPPVIAALRLPLMLVTGLLLVLILDALMLLAADNITDGDLSIDSFWSALGVALVASAVSVVLDVVFGTNDDDAYTLRVIQRIAKRSDGLVETDAPGIIYLEIDGLALPVLQRAMRDGNAPNMARWLVEGGYTLTEWETDLSSQTGASQAGILLGSNEDIPAFRWVEKETATTMACSAPPDCAEIERRHAGHGLLRDGGASRGNLLSGEADHCILTVSRMDEEKKANPGYRAFLANGFNVTRVLVLLFWEVVLELSASSRAKRRDVRPRGHRGGYYPLMRGALCVFVRDLIVYGVLQDMMKGRPAIYATFSSYDEVAHHSGLERADTLEALRKLDQQFGRIERARPYAPRPVRARRPLRPRPDPGSDLQAAQRLRARRARRALALARQRRGHVRRRRAELDGRPRARRGDRNGGEEGEAQEERRLRPGRRRDGLGQPRARLPDGGAAPADARGDERAPPRPDPGPPQPPARRLAARPLVRARARRARRQRHALPRRRHGSRATIRSRAFSPNAPQHLLRTDGFTHVADIMIGSFYDPALETGCAFEELISFHGGIGGPQTRPFILHPAELAAARRRDRRRRRRARDPARLEARAQRHRRAGVRRRALRSTARVMHATVHVLFYALAAAASPLVLTATFVVIRSDRPRTNGIAFLSGFLLGTSLACGRRSARRPGHRREARLARHRRRRC